MSAGFLPWSSPLSVPSLSFTTRLTGVVISHACGIDYKILDSSSPVTTSRPSLISVNDTVRSPRLTGRSLISWNFLNRCVQGENTQSHKTHCRCRCCLFPFSWRWWFYPLLPLICLKSQRKKAAKTQKREVWESYCFDCSSVKGWKCRRRLRGGIWFTNSFPEDPKVPGLSISCFPEKFGRKPDQKRTTKSPWSGDWPSPFETRHP